MQNRMRLLMVATALLYIGPLLAGLGGYGWATVPLFLALFLIWIFILRPQQWPRSLHDWLNRYEPWAALGTNAAVQLLLVLLLFGLGRGIGGALGFTPGYGESLPLAISFLSIPLARLIWDPWKYEHLNNFLDEAIHKTQAGPPGTVESALDLARRLIAPIAALPDSADASEVARHLLALAPHAEAGAVRTALMERHHAGEASPAESLALLLHATDPELIETVPGDGPTLALALLPKTPEILALYARRLAAALTANPELWGKAPSVEHLQDLVTDFDNTAAEAPLRDLIEATNAAQPEDGLA
jgi:hypothetical protein